MSGTLNSPEELKYLTINVIKATKLELSLAEVQLLPEASSVPAHVLRHVFCRSMRSQGLQLRALRQVKPTRWTNLCVGFMMR